MQAAPIVERFEIHDVSGPTPCVAISPAPLASDPTRASLPLCLFLPGGGGSEETLLAIAPLLERAWSNERLPPMIVATARVPPFGFYLDDPARGEAWETLVAEELPRQARERFDLDPAARSSLVGISMGGYAALKMAFARPEAFTAVAAVSPMIEPAFSAASVPLRNRYHYPPEVPEALLGAERDAALYERDHPACRAIRHAEAIRASDLRIFLDAASRDALHAHDGCELLHRTLWELDVAHEYHLWRDADHVGGTLPPRLSQAFEWVGAQLAERRAPTEEETALRASLAEAHRAAAELDATMTRRYGPLATVTLPGSNRAG